MKTTSRFTVPRYDRGATLIEVLIAAVVVGIGLLGVAAMQLTSLQASSNSQYRATAVDIAWTLADRMRANLPGFAADGYSVTATANCGQDPSIDRPADTLAGFDLGDVACTASELLPGGSIAVTCDTGAGVEGSRADITVTWTTRTDYDGSGSFTDSVSIRVIPGFDPSP